MKVYMDLTEFMRIEAITGIQRVVREIVLRFLKYSDVSIVLLCYSDKYDCYRVIDNDKFYEYFGNDNKGDRSLIYSNLCLQISELESGAVFYDLDVAWTATLKRSYLLPILKRQGVRIVALIHDIMEITHYQYFTAHFTYTFMEYIGAHLQYADTIIVDTNASRVILKQFAQKVGIEHVDVAVAYMGADFQKKADKEEPVQNSVQKIAEKRKYILMVGTIEPRKNHQLVLDAYDRGLGKLGYNIIFAGIIGWNSETFLKNLRNHPMYGKRLFHISNATNTDLDYLYKHAKLVAFPTHMEGFGLPLVEALERGVPVIATDIDVLKETGGEYCYYFKDNDVKGFVNCVKQVERDNDNYCHKREMLKTYRPTTWDETADIMMNVLRDVAGKGAANGDKDIR